MDIFKMENTSDVISRQMALKALKELSRNTVFDIPAEPNATKYYRDALYDACQLIKSLPTVQPKRGKWKGYNTDKEGWKRTDGSPVFMSCSECNGVVLNNGSAHWNFCPNCGADMRGEAE
jgi:hypothetical protein